MHLNPSSDSSPFYTGTLLYWCEGGPFFKTLYLFTLNYKQAAQYSCYTGTVTLVLATWRITQWIYIALKTLLVDKPCVSATFTHFRHNLDSNTVNESTIEYNMSVRIIGTASVSAATHGWWEAGQETEKWLLMLWHAVLEWEEVTE